MTSVTSMTTLPAIGGRGAMTSWDNTSAVTMRTMTTSSPSRSDVMNGTRDYVISEEVKERIVAISIIMACTLVGNLTLILILLCKRSRRIKRVNIFLINLAFGDLAVALFVNSTEILFLAFGDWVLGSLMCKGMVYVQMVCLASATNLLTAMTLDRYQVIVKPMETLARRPRILLKITIAWVLSLIFPLPQLFIFVQYDGGPKYDGTAMRICGSKGYTAQWQRKVYFTFTTTYILIVPMLIMLYCYAQIIHVVWVRASTDALHHTTSSQQMHQHQQQQLQLQQQNHRNPNHSHNHNHNHNHHQNKHQQNNHRNAKLDYTSGNKTSKTGTTLTLKARRNHGKDISTPTTKKKDGGYCKTTVSQDNSRMNSPTSDPGSSCVKWARNVRGKPPTTDNKEETSTPSPKNNNSSAVAAKKNSTASNAASVQVSVRRKMMTSSKRRVVTMTLSVVMSFFICHTPYFVLSLIRIYSDYRIKMETGKVIGEFMVMVHSTLNPLLYGLFTLRQKHLKYLISLVSCYYSNSRRRRRSGSAGDDLDGTKGEMHCLLRRRPTSVSKATTVNSQGCVGDGNNQRSDATDVATSNDNSVVSGNTTAMNGNNNDNSSNNNNKGTESPSSLSTSASSSPTSLKSSILSRFRRKPSQAQGEGNVTSYPVLLSASSAGAARGGEREDNSGGADSSLLYSNSDALHKCSMSMNSIDDHHLDRTATSHLSASDSILTSNTESPKSNSPTLSSSPRLTVKGNGSRDTRRVAAGCKKYNRNNKHKSYPLSPSSSTAAKATATTTTKPSSSASQLPPLPPPPPPPPSLPPLSSLSTASLPSSSLLSSTKTAKQRRSTIDSGKSIDEDGNDFIDEIRHRPRHKQKHRHHHRRLLRNKKPTFDSDSDDSSTVLTNPSVSLEANGDAAGLGTGNTIVDCSNDSSVRNGYEDKKDGVTDLVVTGSQKEMGEEDSVERRDVEVEEREEEEEDEEEEEEIIHPVDFNSVPWEDEFIIGGLSRV